MIPVIADIVSSRELDDRRTAQRAIEFAFAKVVDILPAHARPVRPFAAVVGDEFQGAFPTLRAALAATLLVRLALPAVLDLRFGLGLGEVEEIPSTSGSLSEGPGWWAARAAIEHVEEIADLMPHMDDADSSSAGLSDVGGPEMHEIEVDAPNESTARRVRQALEELAFDLDAMVEFEEDEG